MKSLGNRYSSTGKNEDAIQLLSESGKKLLAVNEILEGNDLINLALDIASKMYNKENPLPGEIKERFISVYETYPYCKQQFQFINRVLKCFFPNTGDELIYRAVGQDLISKQKYFLAQKYVLHLNDQDMSIQVLKNFVQNKQQTEQEFIIARYVLIKNNQQEITDQESVFEQIVEKNYNIDIQNLSKLNVNQLVDIINRYDDFVNVYIAKQTQKNFLLEDCEEKLQNLEQQKKNLQQDNEQLSIQVQEIQKLLNQEMTKQIETQQEMSLIQNQNQLLKKKVQENANVGAGGRASMKNSFLNQSQNEDFEPRYKIEMDPDSQLLLFTNEKELQQLRSNYELIQSDCEALLQKLKAQNREITEEHEKKKTEQEEEEGEEEDFTFEELLMNCWDSLATFSENMENLQKNMTKLGQDKENIIQQGKDQNSKQEKDIKDLKEQLVKANQNSKELTQKYEQVQEDFKHLSENYSEQREQNQELQDKIRKLHNDLVKKDQEIDQCKETMQNIIEEKNSLKDEMVKLSGMFSNEEANYKTKIEEILAKENEEKMQKDQLFQQEVQHRNQELDELEKDYNKSLEELKQANNQIKELEKKLFQENLNIKKVEKELSKLDEKFVKTKRDLQDSVEENDKNREKIKKLEEKRILDKKRIKEQKNEIDELKNNKTILSQQQLESFQEKELELELVKSQLQQLQEKSDLKEEMKKLTVEKDMKINNLELKIETLQTNKDQIKTENTQLQNEKQKLEQMLRQKENIIKQMQEKRELALQEIKRLTVQIEMMKNMQNPSQIQKMKQIEDLIEKADRLNHSFTSEHNQNLDNNSPSLTHLGSRSVMGTPQSNKQNFVYDQFNEMNFSRQSSSFQQQQSQQQQSNLNKDNNPRIQKQNTQIPILQHSQTSQNSTQNSQQQNDFSLRELKCLQILMAELQKLYKEFIIVAFSIKDNQELLKFDKKFNDMIKKSQDMMDHLEDTIE
ncbi:hypothetical protein PPERSA_07118 [Pseudocohnilembus persalinus]|uniref:Uncharacterized protein n=1 Tax=Pseudocohnilembus persalinus TaxID=266149 RepID=A0A0V0QXI1_PSEPJ|nr:hypothetical protein PPERSA_07118 [Pseudocohnilembus persalinus]|eukprot:KRX06955.1 hypothetical protein PPERSA_07118 [Pseudocohnilembus persalinus]